MNSQQQMMREQKENEEELRIIVTISRSHY